jgi:thiosulfate reductase cytochrome b subunit
MKILEKKHPLAIRWFHWINFPVLAIMIWSGLLIYWANDVYRVGPFHFFPDWFYTKFHIGSRLAEGMAWHFFFAWFFILNGIAYVLYTAFSGEWRYLLPNRNTFKEAFQVMLHDLFLSKKHPPRRKFNGAQQLAYTGVIVMGVGSVITGLAIFRPVQFAWLLALCGGYTTARLIHFVLTIAYVLFFLVHIVQVIRSGWNNFRAMVTGYEVVKVEEGPIEPEAVINPLPAQASGKAVKTAVRP